MAISDSDCKVLWGRAAGICSNPTCRTDLTQILEQRPYNIGEMAHIIARRPSGPRGVAGGGADTYENLLLLCPSCHTRIDKAPDEYPEFLLRQWKADHESNIRQRGSNKKFDNFELLKRAVTRLLTENHAIWNTFGPHSEIAESDPDSNVAAVWDLRKLDTILPNNREIINLIGANEGLLSSEDYEAFLLFKNHALAFERSQFDRLDKYPLFPSIFEERFHI
jgi:hypothetical protein